MRIALYHNLPPGGALRYMNEVVRRSAEQHDYTVFTPRMIEAGGPLRPAVAAVALAREERRVAAAINRGGFDVAFVHGCRVMQAPGVLTELTVPSVYMCQEPRRRSFEPGYRPGAAVRRGAARALWAVGSRAYDTAIGRRDRRAVAAATALACNSAFSAEAIARAYGREATVCYPGVDAERFQPSTDAPRRTHYLSVGAIDATKGHDLAVDAVARLADRDRLPLVIVGPRTSSETVAALQAQARVAEVDLDVRESVHDNELVDLYRTAAATLCVARLEPFGLTALESISAGTPVVAVGQGGYFETVTDGVTGALTTRSPAAVAEGIGRVAALRLADNPAALHAEAARWTWDATVKALHELFGDVAAGNA